VLLLRAFESFAACSDMIMMITISVFHAAGAVVSFYRKKGRHRGRSSSPVSSLKTFLCAYIQNLQNGYKTDCKVRVNVIK
jgi:hypothetical protein